VKGIKMKLSLLALVFGMCLGARADWQSVQQGQYQYWENGQSQAFPVTNNGFVYHKLQGESANEWSFYHPLYVDPQSGQVVFRIYWTDGSRIAQRLTTDPAWTESTTCGLGEMKNYVAEKYRQFLSQSQSDYRAFYAAEYFEADRLFSACKQILLRSN
jgi:hypothetical protein